MLNHFLFAFASATDPTPGRMTAETLNIGMLTTGVGLGIVCLILVVLSIIIALLVKFLPSKKRKAAKKEALENAVLAAEAAAETEAEVAAAAAPGLDKKTIAAITAAVCAASGRSMEQLKFTAIRRTRTFTSAWGNSGTSEIIRTRQQYL